MGAVQINEQYLSLLSEGLRSVFWLNYNESVMDSKIPVLFNVQTSSKAQEKLYSVGSLGLWGQHETGKLNYDTFEGGFETTFNHEEFDQAIAIERKLIDDEMYGVMNQAVSQMAISGARKREIDAASVFNNATSASYVGGDAVSLVNNSHPLSPSNAAVQDNYLASTALSYPNIDTARQAMRAFTDDRGQRVGIKPDTLLVPAELEETARALFATPNKVDTTDQHANIVSTWLRQIVVWDELTSATTWFLIDSRRARQHLHWFDRIPVEFRSDPTSDFNLVLKNRGYMRYSYGWSDWRWCLGAAA